MNINEENEDKKYLFGENNLEDDDINQGDQTDESSAGENGQGGRTGEIVFRFKDAASLDPRDDMLPAHEIRRLLTVHKDIHKERVDKQKLTRKEREALKAGRLAQVAAMRRQALGVSSSSQYKKHPISNKAQFSGIDKQMMSLPTELDAQTNLEMREKLENRLTNRLTNVPKNTPKLRPRGA